MMKVNKKYSRLFIYMGLILLITACTSQQPKPQMHSTLKRDFTPPLKHWKNGVTVTKDGHTVTRTEDERTYRIASYKNGKKDGVWAMYPKELYKQLIEAHYVNGVKEGICRLYYVDTLYVNGKKEGIEREFNEKFLIRSTPYGNDKKEGHEAKYHYISGALSEVNMYRKGKKQTSTAYTNGKVTNITECDGEMYHGLDQTWSQKGHILLSVMSYRFGIVHGLQKVYYPDGKIRYEVPYESGKKNGVLRAYYPGGLLHYKITYKNDLPDELGYVYSKTGRKERIDYDTLMAFADKLPKPVKRWRQ